MRAILTKVKKRGGKKLVEGGVQVRKPHLCFGPIIREKHVSVRKLISSPALSTNFGRLILIFRDGSIGAGPNTYYSLDFLDWGSFFLRFF